MSSGWSDFFREFFKMSVTQSYVKVENSPACSTGAFSLYLTNRKMMIVSKDRDDKARTCFVLAFWTVSTSQEKIRSVQSALRACNFLSVAGIRVSATAVRPEWGVKFQCRDQRVFKTDEFQFRVMGLQERFIPEDGPQPRVIEEIDVVRGTGRHFHLDVGRASGYLQSQSQCL